MIFRLHATLATILLVLGLATAALAAPSLRPEITVISEVVTVGDMFEDAGLLAEQGLFLAPRPGTIGTVGIDAVRRAALQVGISAFESDGIEEVSVARAATVVDAEMLTGLMAADLRERGIIDHRMSLRSSFDSQAPVFNAEAVSTPARLLTLRYMPGSSSFAARFEIAGMEAPIDLTGHLEFMIAAPHLVASRPAGAILQAADIEMREVPFKFAENTGIPDLADLVGKQLQRHSHAGLMLKRSDVDEPRVVRRNAPVTMVLRSGAMTLTVKGQALNDAGPGQPVQVLNPKSNRILHGVATTSGTVEVTSTLNLAGL